MSQILTVCLVLAIGVFLTASLVRANEATPAKSGSGTGAKSMRVYVGTYTGPKSKGIHLFDLDLTSGALKEVGVAAEVVNPSFLALSPDHKHLYAVGEMEKFKGKKAGAVSAFSVDPATGKLTLLNQQPSGGAGPCHLTTDGKHVFAANYGGGSVSSFPLDANGKLGAAASVIQHEGKSVDPARQKGPHAHGIWPSPNGKFVLACDLGLDKVLVYKLDAASGKLTPNDPAFGKVPDGAGARHAAFSPDGKFLYVINEMGNSMTAFAWDGATGTLKPIQTLPTLPADFKDKSHCAEVMMHPSGKFVYGSNRGHDSIVGFKIDPTTGMMTSIGTTPCGGDWPRGFGIDPTGQWLIVAHEKSDSLAAFKIDPETGGLTQVEGTTPIGKPACVTFAPGK